MEGNDGTLKKAKLLLAEQFAAIVCTYILSEISPSASVNESVNLMDSWLCRPLVFTDSNFKEGVEENLSLLHEMKNNINMENNRV